VKPTSRSLTVNKTLYRAQKVVKLIVQTLTAGNQQLPREAQNAPNTCFYGSDKATQRHRGEAGAGNC
jgi:hypothetical protein